MMKKLTTFGGGACADGDRVRRLHRRGPQGSAGVQRHLEGRDAIRAVHDLRQRGREREGRRGDAHRAGHDAVQEGRDRKARREDRRRAAGAATRSRCCRSRSSTTSCATGSRVRSTATRTSGTTRSWPTRPIHIVVEHSRVTLTGVVQSDVERMLARSIAGSQFGVMSVDQQPEDGRRGARTRLKKPSELQRRCRRGRAHHRARLRRRRASRRRRADSRRTAPARVSTVPS